MKVQQFLLFLLSLFSASRLTAQHSFQTIALSHTHRYPGMEAQDFYKLVYQAAMGNEHLMTDTTALRRYLQNELASVQQNSAEPLLEYISPDSSLARINLRPFKEKSLDPDMLLDAMLKTATAFEKSTENLQRWWSELEELSHRNIIPIRKKVLQEYFVSMKRQHFPAKHHSTSYSERYKPAYRIVLVRYLPQTVPSESR